MILSFKLQYSLAGKYVTLIWVDDDNRDSYLAYNSLMENQGKQKF